MKLRLAVVLLVGLVLACVGCMLDTSAHQAEAEREEERIDAQVATVIDLVAESRITGDSSALEQYLAAEDPDGELRAVVDRALAGKAAARNLDEWGHSLADLVPPGEIAAGLGDGDVLLFAGDDVVTADLLDLVFVNAYSHAGIVSKTVDPAATVVLSSTVTNPDGSGFLVGVRFQTLEELYLTSDTWTRIRPPAVENLAPGWAGLFSGDYNADNTVYGFLNLRLDPVTREDEVYWYCSKVPWRVYSDYGGADIENAGFYDPNRLLFQMENSLLFQLYAYLYYSLPWWLRRHVTAPEEKLVRVLDELITPDELRYTYDGRYDEFEEDQVMVWGSPAPEYLWFPPSGP